MFCREAAPPGLHEGHDAGKAASSGVRLGSHCFCVMVSPVHAAFIHLFKLSFSADGHFKQIST